MHDRIKEYQTPKELEAALLEAVKAEVRHRGHKISQFRFDAGSNYLLAEETLNLLITIGFEGRMTEDDFEWQIKLTKLPAWLFTYQQNPIPVPATAATPGIQVPVSLLQKILSELPASSPNRQQLESLLTK